MNKCHKTLYRLQCSNNPERQEKPFPPPKRNTLPPSLGLKRVLSVLLSAFLLLGSPFSEVVQALQIESSNKALTQSAPYRSIARNTVQNAAQRTAGLQQASYHPTELQNAALTSESALQIHQIVPCIGSMSQWEEPFLEVTGSINAYVLEHLWDGYSEDVPKPRLLLQARIEDSQGMVLKGYSHVRIGNNKPSTQGREEIPFSMNVRLSNGTAYIPQGGYKFIVSLLQKNEQTTLPGESLPPSLLLEKEKSFFWINQTSYAKAYDAISQGNILLEQVQVEAKDQFEIRLSGTLRPEVQQALLLSMRDQYAFSYGMRSAAPHSEIVLHLRQKTPSGEEILLPLQGLSHGCSKGYEPPEHQGPYGPSGLSALSGSSGSANLPPITPPAPSDQVYLPGASFPGLLPEDAGKLPRRVLSHPNILLYQTADDLWHFVSYTSIAPSFQSQSLSGELVLQYNPTVFEPSSLERATDGLERAGEAPFSWQDAGADSALVGDAARMQNPALSWQAANAGVANGPSNSTLHETSNLMPSTPDASILQLYAYPMERERPRDLLRTPCTINLNAFAPQQQQTKETFDERLQLRFAENQNLIWSKEEVSLLLCSSDLQQHLRLYLKGGYYGHKNAEDPASVTMIFRQEGQEVLRFHPEEADALPLLPEASSSNQYPNILNAYRFAVPPKLSNGTYDLEIVIGQNGFAQSSLRTRVTIDIHTGSEQSLENIKQKLYANVQRVERVEQADPEQIGGQETLLLHGQLRKETLDLLRQNYLPHDQSTHLTWEHQLQTQQGEVLYTWTNTVSAYPKKRLHEKSAQATIHISEEMAPATNPTTTSSSATLYPYEATLPLPEELPPGDYRLSSMVLCDKTAPLNVEASWIELYRDSLESEQTAPLSAYGNFKSVYLQTLRAKTTLRFEQDSYTSSSDAKRSTLVRAHMSEYFLQELHRAQATNEKRKNPATAGSISQEDLYQATIFESLAMEWALYAPNEKCIAKASKDTMDSLQELLETTDPALPPGTFAKTIHEFHLLSYQENNQLYANSDNMPPGNQTLPPGTYTLQMQLGDDKALQNAVPFPKAQTTLLVQDAPSIQEDLEASKQSVRLEIGTETTTRVQLREKQDTSEEIRVELILNDSAKILLEEKKARLLYRLIDPKGNLLQQSERTVQSRSFWEDTYISKDSETPNDWKIKDRFPLAPRNLERGAYRLDILLIWNRDSDQRTEAQRASRALEEKPWRSVQQELQQDLQQEQEELQEQENQFQLDQAYILTQKSSPLDIQGGLLGPALLSKLQQTPFQFTLNAPKDQGVLLQLQGEIGYELRYALGTNASGKPNESSVTLLLELENATTQERSAIALDSWQGREKLTGLYGKTQTFRYFAGEIQLEPKKTSDGKEDFSTYVYRQDLLLPEAYREGDIRLHASILYSSTADHIENYRIKTSTSRIQLDKKGAKLRLQDIRFDHQDIVQGQQNHLRFCLSNDSDYAIPEHHGASSLYSVTVQNGQGKTLYQEQHLALEKGQRLEKSVSIRPSETEKIYRILLEETIGGDEKTLQDEQKMLGDLLEKPSIQIHTQHQGLFTNELKVDITLRSNAKYENRFQTKLLQGVYGEKLIQELPSSAWERQGETYVYKQSITLRAQNYPNAKELRLQVQTVSQDDKQIQAQDKLAPLAVQYESAFWLKSNTNTSATTIKIRQAHEEKLTLKNTGYQQDTYTLLLATNQTARATTPATVPTKPTPEATTGETPSPAGENSAPQDQTATPVAASTIDLPESITLEGGQEKTIAFVLQEQTPMQLHLQIQAQSHLDEKIQKWEKTYRIEEQSRFALHAEKASYLLPLGKTQRIDLQVENLCTLPDTANLSYKIEEVTGETNTTTNPEGGTPSAGTTAAASASSTPAANTGSSTPSGIQLEEGAQSLAFNGASRQSITCNVTPTKDGVYYLLVEARGQNDPSVFVQKKILLTTRALIQNTYRLRVPKANLVLVEGEQVEIPLQIQSLSDEDLQQLQLTMQSDLPAGSLTMDSEHIDKIAPGQSSTHKIRLQVPEGSFGMAEDPKAAPRTKEHNINLRVSLPPSAEGDRIEQTQTLRLRLLEKKSLLYVNQGRPNLYISNELQQEGVASFLLENKGSTTLHDLKIQSADPGVQLLLPKTSLLSGESLFVQVKIDKTYSQQETQRQTELRIQAEGQSDQILLLTQKVTSEKTGEAHLRVSDLFGKSWDKGIVRLQAKTPGNNESPKEISWDKNDLTDNPSPGSDDTSASTLQEETLWKLPALHLSDLRVGNYQIELRSLEGSLLGQMDFQIQAGARSELLYKLGVEEKLLHTSFTITKEQLSEYYQQELITVWGTVPDELPQMKVTGFCRNLDTKRHQQGFVEISNTGNIPLTNIRVQITGEKSGPQGTSNPGSGNGSNGNIQLLFTPEDIDTLAPGETKTLRAEAWASQDAKGYLFKTIEFVVFADSPGSTLDQTKGSSLIQKSSVCGHLSGPGGSFLPPRSFGGYGKFPEAGAVASYYSPKISTPSISVLTLSTCVEMMREIAKAHLNIQSPVDIHLQSIVLDIQDPAAGTAGGAAGGTGIAGGGTGGAATLPKLLQKLYQGEDYAQGKELKAGESANLSWYIASDDQSLTENKELQIKAVITYSVQGKIRREESSSAAFQAQSLPYLQMEYFDIPNYMVQGKSYCVKTKIHNTGKGPAKNLHLLRSSMVSGDALIQVQFDAAQTAEIPSGESITLSATLTPNKTFFLRGQKIQSHYENSLGLELTPLLAEAIVHIKDTLGEEQQERQRRRGMPEGISCANDPIDLSSGAQIIDIPLLKVASSIPLEYNLTYNSQLQDKGNTGNGWTNLFDIHLSTESSTGSTTTSPSALHPNAETTSASSLCVHYNNVKRSRFTLVNAEKTPLPWGGGTALKTYQTSDVDHLHDRLYETEQGYILQGNASLQYHFSRQGELLELCYPTGEKILFTQGKNPEGSALAWRKIQDSQSGMYLQETYGANGFIQSVQDHSGRNVRFTYDEKGNLVQLQKAGGQTITYTYDGNGRLISGTDENGQLQFHNTYDEQNRIIAQYDQNSQTNPTRITYEEKTSENAGGTQTTPIGQSTLVTTLTDRKGYTKIYTHDLETGRILRIEDAQGILLQRSYNQKGQKLSETDANGHTTTYAWDEANHLIQTTAPEGEVTTYAYDKNGNRTATTYSDGTSSILTYDDKQNPITIGRGTLHQTMTWDRQGKLQSLTLPTGEIIALTQNKGQITKITRPNPAAAITGNTGRGTTGTPGTEATASTVSTILQRDNLGRIVRILDPLGGENLFTWDDNDCITSYQDKNGNKTTYAYDKKGNLIEKRDPLGGTEKRSYDLYGNLTSVTDKRGHSIRYTYDEEQRLIDIQTKTGAHIRYQVTPRGYLQHSIDQEGRQTSYTHDPKGNLLLTQRPDATESSYLYDKNDRLLEETHSQSGKTTYRYDAQGRIISKTNALGKTTSYTYDPNGHLQSISDPLGGKITYRYNENGTLQSITHQDQSQQRYETNGSYLQSSIDPKGQKTLYTYDALGRLQSVQNPRGGKRSYTYDKEGNLLQLQDEEGALYTWSYDKRQQVQSFQTPLGATTTYAYDEEGNLLQKTDPLGATQSYTYDEEGKQTSAIHPRGGQTSYTYDQSGKLLSQKTPNGNTITYLYNAAGQRTHLQDNMGPLESYTYNQNGQLQTITRGAGEGTGTAENPGYKTHYTYDALGRVSSIQQGTLLRQCTYDANDNLIQSKETPVARANQGSSVENNSFASDIQANPVPGETYDYDPYGRLQSIQQAKNQRSYAYDKTGNLLQTDKTTGAREQPYPYPEELITTATYDSVGRLQTIFDPAGQQTHYTYDQNGNLHTKQEPLGEQQKIQTLTWDENDQLQEYQNGRHQKTTYTYSKTGLLLEEKQEKRTIRYTYDKDRRLIKCQDNSGSIETAYNQRGQITSIQQNYHGQIPRTIRYSYNQAGDLTSVTYPKDRLSGKEKTVTYSYDIDGNIQTVIDWNHRQTRYTYDQRGRQTTWEKPGGSKEERSYNLANQLLCLEEKNPQGSSIYRIDLRYDENGRLCQRNYSGDQAALLNGTQSLRELRDALAEDAQLHTTPSSENDLTSDEEPAVTTTMQQPAGEDTDASPRAANTAQPQTIRYTYSSGNLLQSINGKTVQNDQDGNVIKLPWQGRTLLVSAAYDQNNRLTQFDQTSYAYDAQGQKIRSVHVGVITDFISDTDEAGLSRLLIEAPLAGASTYYIYGNGLLGQEKGGDYQNYSYDQQGNTLLLSKENGQRTQSLTYDPYGNIQSSFTWDAKGKIISGYGELPLASNLENAGNAGAFSPPKVALGVKIGPLGIGEIGTNKNQPRFTYSGQWGIQSEPNGLLYMRARFYSPQIHRFLTADSLAGDILQSQSQNLYTYVQADPVNYIDPTGHIATPFAEVDTRMPLTPRARDRYAAWVDAGCPMYDQEYGRRLRHPGDTALQQAQEALEMAKTGNSSLSKDPMWDYLSRSAKQVVYGNYTDEVTGLGTLGQIGLGLLGLDLPADIRDLWYDATHWECTWDHARQTGLDLVSILPLVGMLKYADELAALVKHGDEAAALVKHGDKAAALVKHGDEVIDSAKGATKGAAKDWTTEPFKTGKDAEIYLAEHVGGESQVYFKTEGSCRFVDQLSKGIAHESKVGYTTATDFVKKQVMKDAELIARNEFQAAEWHFFRSAVTGKIGPSKPLIEFLKDHGITYTIHQ